ncbi:phage tail tape measure protein [Sphingopyxis sp. 113P3]|uniref:phage tail tape measure protein n=1 Tax=Sphingopyxis sp. (strain 113P3) TaxID=292913 RepID=UPI0006AD336F|nr:phage tail tape measure protein [Sphingopyxis sp. 113P3]ALC12467.1 hypothetical protein LH20_10945 [Sphingopyxis sp. 113P3]
MDIAALALNINSEPVEQAIDRLDRFAAASDRAANAAKKVSSTGSTAKLGQEYDRAARAADQASGSIGRIADTVARANRALVAANDNTGRSFASANAHIDAYRKHLASLPAAANQAATSVTNTATAVTRLSALTQQADSHVIAYRTNLERLATANKAAAGASGTAAAQVTAVGAATRTTSSLASGLMGILGGLVGVIIGSLIGAVMEWVAGLWEADKAMKAVEMASDGLGDAQSALGKIFDLTTGKIKSQNEMLILNARLMAANLRGEAARDKEAAASGLSDARNATIRGYAGALQRTLNPRAYEASQFEREKLQDIARRVDIGILGESAAAKEARNIDFSKTGISESDFLNTLAKRYSSVAKIKIAEELEKSLDTGSLSDVFREDGPAGRARTSGTRGGGKTEAERIADFIRQAKDAIEVEEARAKAIEMSAVEAAELEQRTKLLNQAEQSKIKITPQLTEDIDKLAKAYAAAKVDADTSEVVKKTTDEIQRQRDAIADEIALIGLRGEAYDRARREQDAQRKLRGSLPEGSIYVGDNLTGRMSDDIEKANRDRRIAEIKQGAEDATYAMDLERAGLELTGQAALEYSFIVDRLNDAKRAGINLSPAELAAIYDAAEAYAAQRYALDQQAKKIADTREIARNFFTDMMSGLRQSGNAFQAFADAATNALDRIIDKLLNQVLDDFLFNLFPSSAAKLQSSSLTMIANNPSIFAHGGAFDQAQRFATGSAFANSIISTPTLFKFAKGTKLGLMGEAGPEAVMPLGRTPDGKLGVHAMGGGGGGSPATIKMGDIHQEIRIDGGFTPETAVAMIRQGGQATIEQIRRELRSMLVQLDQDGTLQ